MAKSRSVADKIKDVVTLKTAQENFFKNDGSAQQWLAHGSTEAANMILHGHPAPVYAGNIAPPDQISNDFADPSTDAMPLDASAATKQSNEISFLSQTMEDIQRRSEINEPEMELDH